MPAETRIDVVGLRDFERELRSVNQNLPKELRKTNKKAADVVADATRASLASRGGVAPKVAPSVKSLAQQRSASVKIGGARFPFALGSNFGSVRYRQFPRPTKPDYSLFRSIQAKREKVIDVYGDGLDKLMRRVFPD